jgi:phage/plasmid-like protein (TIGR03299 family)
MAHEIHLDQKTGEHAFFSRQEIPWHRLGQIVPDALTSEEAIKVAHLDYEVEQFPLLADLGAGGTAPVLNKFATVRTDTNQCLGIVGNQYEIVQNVKAFDFVDGIVGSKQAIFETAGALGGGERIFVTAKLPSYIRLGSGDDVIEEYILFYNSHDGSGSVQGGFTNVRVVCNNTLSVAINRGLKNKFNFRHTQSVHDKINRGLEVMKLQRAYSHEFAEAINSLSKVKVDDKLIHDTVNSLFLSPLELNVLAGGTPMADIISSRKKNLIQDMHDQIDRGPGQDLHRGTGLWLFNGVTSYYSNGKRFKNEEKRFDELTGGWCSVRQQEVFNNLLEMV